MEGWSQRWRHQHQAPLWESCDLYNFLSLSQRGVKVRLSLLFVCSSALTSRFKRPDVKMQHPGCKALGWGIFSCSPGTNQSPRWAFQGCKDSRFSRSVTHLGKQKVPQTSKFHWYKILEIHEVLLSSWFRSHLSCKTIIVVPSDFRV